MFSIQWKEQSDTYEVPVHAMQAFRGVEVQLHTFLASELQYMNMSGLLHSQVPPGTQWTQGWVWTRVGMDTLE